VLIARWKIAFIDRTQPSHPAHHIFFQKVKADNNWTRGTSIEVAELCEAEFAF
jgi:hypothetical protein